MSKPRPGFTLIELVVVISIVALLIALLLPAIKISRETAREVVCSSNFRQQSIGMLAYTHDYNDTTVPYLVRGVPPDGTYKSSVFYWYPLVLMPYLESEEVWACPSIEKYALEHNAYNPQNKYHPYPPTPWIYYFPMHQAINDQAMGDYRVNQPWAFGPPGKLADMDHPATTIITYDWNVWNLSNLYGLGGYHWVPCEYYYGLENYGAATPVHGENINASWGDGHIENIVWNEVTADTGGGSWCYP